MATQLSQAFAHRRLGHVENLRRAGEAAFPNQYHKRSQMAQIQSVYIPDWNDLHNPLGIV